ncbi:hypothetical protein B0H34DRAFT_707671 [Crassisporium funariophilum]|nr:hypothetical protein B0H34DRAFT_707671 [Crassisporium funariophilum]
MNVDEDSDAGLQPTFKKSKPPIKPTCKKSGCPSKKDLKPRTDPVLLTRMIRLVLSFFTLSTLPSRLGRRPSI